MASLTLTSRINYFSAPADVASESVVLASLVAQEQDPDKARNPVDLVIVLDKSGSMKGGKLDLCIKTLEFLIDQALTEQDFLGLVTFDSSVHVDFEGAKMTAKNKELVRQRVQQIKDGTCTNLSGGLFAGLDLLKARGTSDVSAVCILTDGMMNEGVVDHNQLVQMTQERISSFPIGRSNPSIFTFGYGTDADSRAMKMLSEATGGTYYSIVNPESVPISFADCLGGLSAVAAQTVQLTCEIAGGGAELAGEPLTKFPVERLSASACRILIKDMYCGEHRDILLKIRMPPVPARNGTYPPTEVRLTCRYVDTLHEMPQTTSISGKIERYAGSQPPQGKPDAEVTRHVLRFDATKVMDDARAAAESGNLDQARGMINGMVDKVLKTMQLLGIMETEDLMLKEILSDLKLAANNLASANSYNQFGRAQMATAAMSHAYQRSNKVDLMVESDECIEQSAYAQTSKKTMMKSARAEFGM